MSITAEVVIPVGTASSPSTVVSACLARSRIWANPRTREIRSRVTIVERKARVLAARRILLRIDVTINAGLRAISRVSANLRIIAPQGPRRYVGGLMAQIECCDRHD